MTDRHATGNLEYALAELGRAIVAAARAGDADGRAHAEAKAARWRAVIDGMLGGALAIGSRAPVAGMPTWATLEVAHGGFATGALLANGPLRPHEVALRDRVGGHADARTALNLHFVSDGGRRELDATLATGAFGIEVPEEGALLTVAWLLRRGDTVGVEAVLDAVTPFFDRLRFYPVPKERPAVASSVVRVTTVSAIATQLGRAEPPRAIEQMREAIRIWSPLYDRIVELFLDTIEDGWPCRRYAPDFRARGEAILADYRRAWREHTLCNKPDKPKENFALLRKYLERILADPKALTGRDVGMIRKVLASFVAAHGAPASERHRLVREEQARIAALPLHAELAHAGAERLRRLDPEAGLATLDDAAAAVGDYAIPSHLVAKLERCLEASAEELVERGVITSGEVLARVLPQLTSQIRAAAFTDPELRRLYSAVYAAFRRRRSLLLLNLDHQVRFDELPWIAVLDPYKEKGDDAARDSRRALEQVVALSLASFPYAILPNNLLQEIRALAKGAGLDLPIVDELAADIFMGAFSSKFLAAAKIAARLLRGTLYERYYDLPLDRVNAIEDVQKRRTFGAPDSAAFAELCVELAGPPGARRSVASNGIVIEQQQILTTQNLAVLWDALGLQVLLGPRLRGMCEACFWFVCRRLQMKTSRWKAKLQAVKNCAYAWRQMIFFLSMAEPPEAAAFMRSAQEHLDRQRGEFRTRFTPALLALELATQGQRGPQPRFLGWTTGTHWLLA